MSQDKFKLYNLIGPFNETFCILPDGETAMHHAYEFADGTWGYDRDLILANGTLDKEMLSKDILVLTNTRFYGARWRLEDTHEYLVLTDEGYKVKRS